MTTKRAELKFQIHSPTGTETIEVSGVELSFGRSQEAHVQITDGFASRIHFKVIYDQGSLWIQDNASTNGTFVNGEALPPKRPHRLNVQDLIKIGKSQIEIKLVAAQYPGMEADPQDTSPMASISKFKDTASMVKSNPSVKSQSSHSRESASVSLTPKAPSVPTAIPRAVPDPLSKNKGESSAPKNSAAAPTAGPSNSALNVPSAPQADHDLAFDPSFASVVYTPPVDASEARRILDAAKDEAQKIVAEARKIAQSDAAAIIEEARVIKIKTKDEAKSYLEKKKKLADETTTNAEFLAKKLLDEARSSASELRSQVKSEVAEKVSEAEKEAKAILEKAIQEIQTSRQQLLVRYEQDLQEKCDLVIKEKAENAESQAQLRLKAAEEVANSREEKANRLYAEAEAEANLRREELKREYDLAKQELESRFQEFKAKAEFELNELKTRTEAERELLTSEHQSFISRSKNEYEQSVQQITAAQSAELSRIETAHSSEMRRIEEAHASEVRATNEKNKQELELILSNFQRERQDEEERHSKSLANIKAQFEKVQFEEANKLKEAEEQLAQKWSRFQAERSKIETEIVELNDKAEKSRQAFKHESDALNKLQGDHRNLQSEQQTLLTQKSRIEAEIGKSNSEMQSVQGQLKQIKELLAAQTVLLEKTQQSTSSKVKELEDHLLATRSKIEKEIAETKEKEKRKLDEYLTEESKRIQKQRQILIEDLIQIGDKVAADLIHGQQRILTSLMGAEKVTQIQPELQKNAKETLELSVSKLYSSDFAAKAADGQKLQIKPNPFRQWKPFALGSTVASALLLAYFFTFMSVNWKSNPVQSSMEASLKERQQDLARRKFNPPQEEEIKDRVMDSVIYTRGYVQAYRTEAFTQKLTKSANLYMLKTFSVPEEKTVAAVSLLQTTVTALYEKKESIHPDFVTKDLAKMAELEKQQLDKLKEILGTEVRVEALLKFQKEAFLDFRNRAPANFGQIEPVSETSHSSGQGDQGVKSSETGDSTPSAAPTETQFQGE